jgi:hypothetical protein
MAKRKTTLNLFGENRTPVRKQMCYGEMPFLPVCRMCGSLTLCSGCLWALPQNSPLYVSGFELHSLSELPASINTHLHQGGFFRSSTWEVVFPSLIIIKTLRIYRQSDIRNELSNVKNFRRAKLNINISKFEKERGTHKLLNKTSVKCENCIIVSCLVSPEKFRDSAIS